MKFISSFEQTRVINNYKNEVAEISQENLIAEEKTAVDFNNELYTSNSFDSSLSLDSISSIDLSTNNILAYITIPNISLELPIYEGCNDKALTLGIGHLPNTSLPIGGENTHSVLVGHTGLTNSIMFDNLDKLKIGDNFSITYLDKTLNYEVCQINIVNPNDTSNLIIKPNEDLVTLVTCTPKHVNTHRLLVTGKRIILEENQPILSKSENSLFSSSFYDDLPVVINVIFIHLFIIFIIYFLGFIKKKI